jgi:iron-sulfur cluster repair protein YtfE (RIC family)
MTANRETQDAVWSFIEHEHLDLVRGINRIHEVASEIGAHAAPELAEHLAGVLRWVQTVLEPHMAWEEAILYSEIDRRAGTRWATRTARFDHHQIRDLITSFRNHQHDLAQHAGTELQAGIRFDLSGLEVLLRAHLEREDRFLLPVLGDDEGPDQRGLPLMTPIDPVVEAGDRG